MAAAARAAEVESPAAAVWVRAAGLAVEVERVGRVEAKGVETVLGVVAGLAPVREAAELEWVERVKAFTRYSRDGMRARVNTSHKRFVNTCDGVKMVS